MKRRSGMRPSQIPIATVPNNFVFNWRALKRWRLDESNLPPGSTILYRQLTPWDMYRWYIVGAISLVLLEALLISALLWQRARTRKAELDLAITNERLRLAVEAGRSAGWDWDVESGRSRWFGDLETIFGIASPTYSDDIDDFRRRIHPEDRKLVRDVISGARDGQTPYAASPPIKKPVERLIAQTTMMIRQTTMRIDTSLLVRLR